VRFSARLGIKAVAKAGEAQSLGSDSMVNDAEPIANKALAAQEGQ
jgi:hypothetical protein